MLAAAASPAASPSRMPAIIGGDTSVKAVTDGPATSRSTCTARCTDLSPRPRPRPRRHRARPAPPGHPRGQAGADPRHRGPPADLPHVAWHAPHRIRHHRRHQLRPARHRRPAVGPYPRPRHPPRRLRGRPGPARRPGRSRHAPRRRRPARARPAHHPRRGRHPGHRRGRRLLGQAVVTIGFEVAETIVPRLRRPADPRRHHPAPSARTATPPTVTTTFLPTWASPQPCPAPSASPRSRPTPGCPCSTSNSTPPRRYRPADAAGPAHWHHAGQPARDAGLRPEFVWAAAFGIASRLRHGRRLPAERPDRRAVALPVAANGSASRPPAPLTFTGTATSGTSPFISAARCSIK